MPKKIVFTLLSLLALVNCTPEQEINAFVKGSFSEIQQQHQGKPYLILFWSEECAYCTKELALLGKVVEKNKDVTLITVATDPFLAEKTVRQKLASYDLQNAEAWVFSDSVPEKLYFDVDQRWRGELPLTYLFDAHNNKTKKVGILKENELTVWLQNTSSPD